MSEARNPQSKTEARNGMCIDWDTPIPMDDGIVLRADVFRPLNQGRYPVLLTYGPYAKGLAFQDGYPDAWETMAREHPDVVVGSTNLYQNWEVVDPEKWVPHGYACVRVDSRGCGRSPGFVDPFSPRETRDFAACIEWAGEQPWSSGKVGLNGISYYGINQWQVASLQPPHLAAMCVWEGAAEWYRDTSYHGGIYCTFWANWFDMQVKTVQHGLGTRGPCSRATGELVCGPETSSEAELAANRCNFGADLLSHPLDDKYSQDRSPDWSKINVPLFSAANWGRQGLHPRGNFEGFLRAASTEKWLEAHGIEHWTHFYTDYGRELQKRFFDYFLKGQKNGWDLVPRVLLQVRHIDRFEERAENEWPLARTDWTKFYLDFSNGALVTNPRAEAAKITFDAMSDGTTLMTPPLATQMEITGPSALKLFLSSSTEDADVFAILRVFSPDLKEVVFQGAIDPHTPIGQGWLRASHRKLDAMLTKPWRPYHTHDEVQPLKPSVPVELDVEIWPTSIVVPAGHRIALTIRGKDYEHACRGGKLSNFKNELRGCGPFLHDDPTDRPPRIFAGKTTLHSDEDRPPYLLLPIIPRQ